MDDAGAAGPKLKWWSRPGHTPSPQPPAEADRPEAQRSAGPAAGAAAAAAAAAPAGTAAAAEQASEAPELTAAPGAIPGPAADPAPAAAGPEQGAAAPRAEREAATVTLGQVPVGAPDEAQPHPPTEPAPRGAADPQPQPTVPAEAAGGAPRRPQPLHPEDPYGTPPYGGPGPWAPAPLVQRPMATPAHGTALPPEAGTAAADAPHPRPAAPGPQLLKAGGPVPAPAAPQDAVPHPGGPHPPAPAAPAAPASAPSGPQLTHEPAEGAFVPHPGDGGPRPVPVPPAAPYAAAPPPLRPSAVPGAWQQYDPWSAPLHGGPAAVPPRARRGRRVPMAVGAVVLALLAGGAGGGVGAYIERNGGIDDIKLPQATGERGSRSPQSVAGIARAALPGVVTLHVRGNAEQGTGTGFVLDRQGHILTNNHVVEAAGSGGAISVTFSGGQTAKARVVGRDGGYDLAVVQVDGVTGLRPLTLGDSDAAQVGDPVVAIGAPYDLANTVTSGIISAKQRPITAGGQKGDGSDVSYVDALQTDAPINPGNSGGPLVDGEARVIGINSAIRAADSGTGGPDGAGGQGGSIGLGFAIPINQAKRVAEELINTGRATHPVIGVTLEMEYAGDGARVSDRTKDGKPPVVPGGPGAKAGIKVGDVITQVDGVPVHSGQELIVKIRSHRPGDMLTLTLQRGGSERSVRLTLGSSSQG
ncbi:trypsin-like peptidase domain-containing protein [Streptomyces sp. GS7]|uniref:trypsin-like peptidase domain-containing protein n=1 Tax=Streptomyces sp. GS7 TaxID=2692234 RepID=UPI001319882F|nr:trypsin-like peptidase domain-containing protein [Streptomyces sp. GS7]QHC25586.1 PDZ domain-containing protein [Streptomyces sp. GS7]